MNPREIFETQGRQPETQLAHTHYNLELIAWHFLQPLIKLPTENVQVSCRWSFLLWNHKVLYLRGAEQIAFRCAFRPFPEWGIFDCTAHGSITGTQASHVSGKLIRKQLLVGTVLVRYRYCATAMRQYHTCAELCTAGTAMHEYHAFTILSAAIAHNHGTPVPVTKSNKKL